MSIFTKKLPKNKVVWCIAIPYTKKHFQRCFDMNSDFLESLKVLYHCIDFDNLWRNYDCYIASVIRETISELKQRNVVIVDVEGLNNLHQVFSYDVVIFTAHKHHFEPKIDLMGISVSLDDFVKCIPYNFSGTLDINSCYSADLLTKITKQAPNNKHIIGIDAKTNVLFKLFLYKSVIKFWVHHSGIDYFNALEQIGYKMIRNANSNNGNDNVYLGGNCNKSEQYGISFPEPLLSELAELTGNEYTVSSLRHLLYEQATQPQGVMLYDLACPAVRFISESCKKKIEKIVEQLTNEIKIIKRKYSISVFAPEQTQKNEIVYIQAYIYENDEYKNVEQTAFFSDRTSVERGKSPFCFALKNGDKIDLTLKVRETDIIETQTIVWNEEYAKYAKVDYFIKIPSDYEFERLYAQIDVSINGALAGDVKFITFIVDDIKKRHLAQNISQGFHHIFISYAHKDYNKIKFLAEAYEAQGVDYFFDKNSLRAGDDWPNEIKSYIADKTDLFVLCWSKYAEQSKWVNNEKNLALSLAYPQMAEKTAKIKMYPLKIGKDVHTPSDMKSHYHFKEI